MADNTRQRFSRWVQDGVEKEGGLRQAAQKSGLVHSTLIRAIQGESMSLSTLEALAKWRNVRLVKVLEMYGEEIPEDRRAEWELGLLLDRRPELRDVLEAAVDVLDEEALESVLEYVRFQVVQAERKSKS
jgi:transcriptional regulator with XRE-family HTH domain